jgi:hypothetical protein
MKVEFDQLKTITTIRMLNFPFIVYLGNKFYFIFGIEINELQFTTTQPAATADDG